MDSKELENILINHSQKYPLMETKDLIKLIYQFTFGPNHLIDKNINKVKEQIFLEAINAHCSKKEIVYIGNDLYRVSLVNDSQYLNSVFECFIKTSKECTNTNTQQLENNIKESINYLSLFPNIKKDEYLDFVNRYLKSVSFSISHSKIYKDTYNPAYRLVHKKYLKFILK